MAVAYPTAARQLLRDTLLDAMRELISEREWGQVSMAEVARAAGVSRQTLYKEFGSREEFAQAFVLREADRFLGEVEQAVHANSDDPGTALTAALTVFLRAAADNPFLRAVTSGVGAEELLPLLTVQGEPLFVHATERLTGVLMERWPEVRERDARQLADVAVRLGVSYAASPSGPPDRTAAGAGRVLEPFVRQALSG
ncbi:MAG TPA: TetR family transcriptional regulator [Thermoleophilaceae bacterium]|nr:TetR family transcriptional regulator [Thermoleophilaceae bacterium]